MNTIVTKTGVMDFADANEMNVPVNIFLSNQDGKWFLSADNFMPRKNYSNGGSYGFECEQREPLAEMVREHVLPLYQVAVSNVERMANGDGEGSNYYWEPHDA